ncbi:MAG: signal peptidase II [Candidatus Omnitrophota bacterium]
MNKIIWVVAVLALLLDQASKFLVSRSLKLNESLAVIKNTFHITLVHNTGAAFGSFKEQTLFFIIIASLAVAAIVIYIRKTRKAFFLRDAALALILGGALGNLTDRLRLGYVIDFLDFRIWPVFNVADSAVTIGAIMLVICIPYSSK